MSKNTTRPVRDLLLLLVFSLLTTLFMQTGNAAPLDRTGTLWAPYIEWSIDNPSYSGNPFDLVASVTFTHSTSGETRTTEMFYSGGTIWKFRFSGTKTGTWTFSTQSTDPELNGLSGQVTINPNPGVYGFVTHVGNQWARQTTGSGQVEPFVPQFRMAFPESPPNPTPAQMDTDIQTHMVDEGFNGIFFFVAGAWVNVNTSGGTFSNNDPDLTMFQAVEDLITKVHAAGGVVHIWYNGDCTRNQCVQAGFGSNGARSIGEQRLLRYIAARLGPLPGWIMGYGYDIVEDATTADLRGWGDFLRSKMGWQHLLGARDQNSNYAYTYWPEADWHSKGNYFGGASYNDIAGVIDSSMTAPHAFDERWWTSRISGGEDGQRRQLWTNMMGGGASAIWGAAGPFESDPYNNPSWFKTHFTFWKNRWLPDWVRDNSLGTGTGLRTADYQNYIFYAENTSSISYDISNSSGALQVIAVDTKGAYTERDLGIKAPGSYTWNAPYQSDWALAIGEFNGTSVNPPSAPSVPPAGESLQQIVN